MKTAATLAPALRDAARMVARVASGRSLVDQFRRAAEGGESARAALLDLTHGTLRRYGLVQGIVAALSRRGPPDPLIQALLWCALYALQSGRYAEYTVVDQAVRATSLLERWPAKAYVNGVLRTYLRSRDALEATLRANEEARHQHPQWWIELVRGAYPERWGEILAAGNTHPPMTLRVNARRIAPADYLKRLAEAGIAASAAGEAAILLEKPVPVERLPGFADGEVSVQDAGAQRAAGLLDLAPGQRVLDACAAPGGKSAHILERADVALTAIDADAERCERVMRNLARLSLRAEVRAADCTRPQTWWDGERFARILADVPCSASGIARRRPDLKWLRRAQDLESFAARQAVILDALWQALRANGKLLYATCSVFPQENDGVISAFVARNAGARRLPLPDGGAAQWLPDAEHDGFYYALIEKAA
jgi:16S rRNA (cytosine967-C5)-methyltransferase